MQWGLYNKFLLTFRLIFSFTKTKKKIDLKIKNKFANTNFNFTIYYDNTNDDTTLDTVGYNLYFDSSQIELLDYGNYSEDFKTDYIQTQYNLYIGGLGDATANMIANMNWTNNYGDDNQIYGTDLKDPNNWTLEIADLNDEVTSMQLTSEILSFTTNFKIYNYEISTGSFSQEENTPDFEMLGNIFISSMGNEQLILCPPGEENVIPVTRL